MKKKLIKNALAALAAATVFPVSGVGTIEPVSIENGKIQKIRFVEDDAQNYMTSKIYEIKHQKANDLVPFILGAIKRYAKNGSADRINYKYGNQQFIAVSCPSPLLPYIDDMIAKLDHPSPKSNNGSGIAGTGITRSIFTPQYRAGETMVNVMIKTGIPSNATEGANQDAVVAYDSATNRIFWKDSGNKDADLKKYLAWLDRPVPQMSLTMNVYEVRESDLLDLGIDYLAWKNGPGLNLFEAGAAFIEGSALAEAFGPYGFFMFAPSFDLSFVRVLQQNGKAKIATSAAITFATGKNVSLSFTPNYQNLTKDDKFASAVNSSNNDKLSLSINSPAIALSGAADKDGRLPYSLDDYKSEIGVLNFNYNLNIKNVVERNNLGDELFEESDASGTVTIQSGCERLLNQYQKEQTVEQTIGVPFLCELPVLKYIFGTTTRSKEKYFYFLTVKTELIHPDTEISGLNGKLTPIEKLVNP